MQRNRQRCYPFLGLYIRKRKRFQLPTLLTHDKSRRGVQDALYGSDRSCSCSRDRALTVSPTVFLFVANCFASSKWRTNRNAWPLYSRYDSVRIDREDTAIKLEIFKHEALRISFAKCFRKFKSWKCQFTTLLNVYQFLCKSTPRFESFFMILRVCRIDFHVKRLWIGVKQ